MTDAEIIKAVGYCYQNDAPCPEDCPLRHDCECFEHLSKAILDLINRQQAEIENYSHEVKQLENGIKNYQAENESLSEAYSKVFWERDVFAEDIKIIEAEAIKEFANDIINNILPKIMYGHNEKAFEISLAISKRTENLVGENK